MKAIYLEQYVRKLDQNDLYQEWSIADLVWLINELHGALRDTLQQVENQQKEEAK
jgi:hypothetical protein